MDTYKTRNMFPRVEGIIQPWASTKEHARIKVLLVQRTRIGV